MSNRINFTKANILKASIPEDGKRVRLYDDKTRGLAIEILSTGTKTFYYRRKQDGKEFWQKLGPFEDLSIEQARGMAAAFNARIAQKEDLHESRAGFGGEPTLRQLFDAYIERHAMKTRKTWQVMVKDFDRNLGHWANRKASHIITADVEALHRKLDKERGPYTANRTLQMLRAIYNKAITWKLFSKDNPASAITLFEEKARERFLSEEEVKRLFQALFAMDESDPQERTARDFILLCLFTGARKSNVAAMRFSEIDSDRRAWTIPETKNGSSQTIALTDQELYLIEQRRELVKGDYVFPGPGANGHVVDLKRSWTTIRKKAQIPDVTLHDLRRNLGSWLASMNVNVALIKGALNHKDMKTTLAVYARTAKDAERDARNAAHKAMMEAAGIEESNVVPFKKIG